MPELLLLPPNILHATGAMLLHSLWQGAVLAAVICMITSLSRAMSAAKRYNLLVGAMLIFCCAAAFTFAKGFSTDPPDENILIANDPSTSAERLKLKTDTTWSGNRQYITGLVRANSNTIVWLWLSVVCFRALQMVVGLRGVRQFRNSALDINAKWVSSVDVLAQQLGVRRAVQLAESSLAKVPMVIGHLKPLILMPVGLLTALSTAEVEAILVHELAHIQRRDYLANLLLSLVEILFFFNPAILWLAALIREDREHCCDDIAVKFTGSKTAYIKALVACEEYQHMVPDYAMAFKGRGGLATRVSRLLSGSGPKFNRLERSLVAICLLGGTLFATAFTHHREIGKAAIRVAEVITPMTQLDEKDSSTVTTTVVTKTTTVSETTAPKPQPVAATDTVKEPKLLDEHDRLADLDAQQAELKHMQAELNKQQQIRLAKHQAEYKAWNDEYDRNAYVSLSPLAKLSVRVDSIRQKPLRIKTGLKVTLDEQNEEPPIILNDEDAAKDVARSLAKAMVAESLATNVTSFKMTSDALVLNSRKLSEQDFARFRDKYVRSFHQGTTIYYNYNVN